MELRNRCFGNVIIAQTHFSKEFFKFNKGKKEYGIR